MTPRQRQRRLVSTAIIVAPAYVSAQNAQAAGADLVLRTEGPINVRDHGVSPENPDNGPALIALRDNLISIDRHRHWHLVFPPSSKPYRYSNNRWLFGLTDWRLEGYGATLQCIWDRQWDSYDSMVFPQHASLFMNKGDQPGAGGMGFHTGDRIDAPKIGDRTIRVQQKEMVRHRGFRTGGWVLVHAFNQQYDDKYGGGYPPNVRYFEFRRVVEIQGDEIVLDEPLTEIYRNDYPDFLYSKPKSEAVGQANSEYIGKPRVVNLSGRPQAKGVLYYPERIRFSGFTIARNPNFPNNHSVFSLNALNTRIEDVSMMEGESYVWLREGILSQVDRVQVRTGFEPDKVLEKLIMNDCTAEADVRPWFAIRAGTGVNHLELNNFEANGIVSLVAQKSLKINGGRFRATNKYIRNTESVAPLEFYGGVFGSELVKIDGVQLDTKSRQSEVLMGYGRRRFYPYKVLKTNDHSILIPRVRVNTLKEGLDRLIRIVRPGFQILENDERTVIGIVRAITEAPENHIAVHLDVSGKMPEPGHTIKVASVQRVILNGKPFLVPR